MALLLYYKHDKEAGHCMVASGERRSGEQSFVREGKKFISIITFSHRLKHVLKPQKWLTQHWIQCGKIHHLKSLLYKKKSGKKS